MWLLVKAEVEEMGGSGKKGRKEAVKQLPGENEADDGDAAHLQS